MSEFGMRGLFKRRIIGAGQHSLEGLKACFEHEEAFRVEVYLGVVLFFFAPWVAGSLLEWILLISALIIVLIVELLNSAVEATIDRIGEEYHELAKRAKDIGSAAVLLSMLLFFITWGAILFAQFFN